MIRGNASDQMLQILSIAVHHAIIFFVRSLSSNTLNCPQSDTKTEDTVSDASRVL